MTLVAAESFGSELGSKPEFGCRQTVKRFAQDDRGALTIMTVVWFLLLFVFAGIGFEIARQDEMRTRFQGALDRGVLAAANLSRDDVVDDTSAQTVVQNFVRAAGFVDDTYNLNVSMTPRAGGRLVQAAATGSLNSSIFAVMGIDTLSVPAVAAAEEVTGLLEIVLVLDVSASMSEPSSDGGTKLSQLQIAAKSFIDTTLTPENIPRTLISIVPYSAQVNLSNTLAAHFKLDGSNPFGNCIDYYDHDFSSVEIDPTVLNPRPESQHFLEDIQYIYSGPWWDRRVVGVNKTFNCPDAGNAVTDFSNDPDALKIAIDGLTAESWTASYMGMKVGAALLDRNSSHAYVEDLVNVGALNSSFDDWPASYISRSTKKIIVLMTDGVNTELRKIEDGYYANHSLTYWDTTYDLSREQLIIDNLAPTVTQTYVGRWCRGRGGRRRCRPRYTYQYDYTYPGDAKLYEICDAFKANPNTVIYTIGYEVAADSQAFTALSGCATNASTAYLVEGVQISTAFANIANDLEVLKLIR